MLRRFIIVLTAAAFIAAAWLWATAPAPVEGVPELPHVSTPVGDWLAQREAQAQSLNPLTAGAEKHITWYGPQGQSTPLAVVYLHGFSATRQEIAPVPERIAHELGANLFATRLSGHGHPQRAMQDITAEDLLGDAAEALAVGRAIGERLVIIGTSTGATLAVAMSELEGFEAVGALILLSPNFGPADPNSEHLTGPGGPQLARLLIGKQHQWEAANDLQARYWTTAYPVDALVEMMRLVQFTRELLPLSTQASLMVIYSPHDTVISTSRIQQSWNLIQSPHRQMILLPDADDPGNPGMHVMTGDIMAPQNTDITVRQVVDFIRARSSKQDDGGV